MTAKHTDPETCPDADLHGSPFRYCPTCPWMEEPPAKTGEPAGADQFLRKAKASVIRVAARYTEEDLYVVWFCKVLGNWKALISTDAVPGLYWEVTYNGAKQETYVDTYKKAFNDCLPDAG